MLLKMEGEWREGSGLFRPEAWDIWKHFPEKGGMGVFVNHTSRGNTLKTLKVLLYIWVRGA